ncbi:MAG: 2-oxoglutarate dehydrogenase E1 component [Myxococcales bacterium]|nr:2-oxoglutarate dehydrogenase E1 component [Myxococcales bacterium]
MSQDFGVNQGLVEEMFLRWAGNPHSVDESWRRFFEGLAPADLPQLTSAGVVPAPVEHAPTNGGNGKVPASAPIPSELSGVYKLPPTAEDVPFVERRGAPRTTAFPPSAEVMTATELQARVAALTNAYRVRGHLYADLDPLQLQPRPDADELFLERYGLASVDPETVFSTGDLAGPSTATLREILDRLAQTYTRTIGVEFTFLEDREARTWLQSRMESTKNRIELSRDEQLRILTKLTDAEIFEQFLHTKFIGAKRFSVEGGESVIPMLDLLVERSAELGVDEIVLGMAHRGRLNVMVNIMEMNVRDIFAGFDDDNPELHLGGGDVKYHLGYSIDRTTSAGHNVHITLTFNPSHLEFVNPVVEGRVRAKQDRRGDVERTHVLPLLIHGDAAFVGQGIVAETLNLSEVTAYATGGTIHVVINNQVGFTTNPEDSRSTRYCTDITRMLRCPVFHVNGEDPEAVAQVVQLAVEYRQRFHRDVVIDLYCYRKYGHNEGDEPRFTQPLMYAAIDKKKTVREIYIDHLVELGAIDRADAQEIEKRRHADLEAALDESRTGDYALLPVSMKGLWEGYVGGSDRDVPEVETAVPMKRLTMLLDRLTVTPEWFTPHSRLRRFLLDKQRQILETGVDVDWGTAENLAMASLLADGVQMRLTGQDVRRGTFSHRHAVIYDVNTGRRFTRLGHLTDDQGRLEIYDSPLSEAGVLGFEWGYSLDSPDALVMWEAQFGDFVNGAQVIIDQFISSSEDKWHRLSGLVLLLPHAFEGMGPEHSSARLERFLGLCAEDNMQVVNLTTPAQIFHCLRRQVVRPWRKPLVVMTPKSLLRHRRAVSTLDDLATGKFQRVIPDTSPEIAEKSVRRVLFCSGKVYFDLLEEREKRGITDIAIVRIEQLYPLRAEDVQAALEPFPKKAELFWVQEEPWNMGAWFYMRARGADLFGKRDLRCVSRAESASPATGSNAAHRLEQSRLLDEALG